MEPAAAYPIVGLTYAQGVISATAGSLRMVRGATVGALALGVSLGGHALAGGGFGVGTALTMGAIATGAGLATSARQFTFVRAFIVLATLQPLLHVILTGSSSHAHETNALPTHADIDMVGAHLAATLVAAAALAALDRVIWQWLRDALPLRSIQPADTVVRVDAPLGLVTQVFSHVHHLVLVSPWRGPPWQNAPHRS